MDPDYSFPKLWTRKRFTSPSLLFQWRRIVFEKRNPPRSRQFLLNPVPDRSKNKKTYHRGEGERPLESPEENVKDRDKVCYESRSLGWRDVNEVPNSTPFQWVRYTAPGRNEDDDMTTQLCGEETRRHLTILLPLLFWLTVQSYTKCLYRSLVSHSHSRSSISCPESQSLGPQNKVEMVKIVNTLGSVHWIWKTQS